MTRRALLALAGAAANAQQVADTKFDPPIGAPTFPPGKGPVVGIDEAHNNFHTASGRYLTFAKLLRKDGYVVRSGGPEQGVLVVANAMVRSKRDAPSAFQAEEVARIAAWVQGGGALLLIVDHQPFPGAVATLASAFGVEFHDGYAVDDSRGGGILRFDKKSGLLREHAITRDVDSVMTFQGSSFRAPGAEPLLVFGDGAVSYVSSTPGRPGGERVSTVPIAGWLQGAVLTHGRRRVAIMGEAAMFSAQLFGSQKLPMGMNHPEARGNARFLLNVMRWLVHA